MSVFLEASSNQNFHKNFQDLSRCLFVDNLKYILPENLTWGLCCKMFLLKTFRETKAFCIGKIALIHEYFNIYASQRTLTTMGEVSLYGWHPVWLLWIWPNKKNCCSFKRSTAAESNQNKQEARNTVILSLKLVFSALVEVIESSYLDISPSCS